MPNTAAGPWSPHTIGMTGVNVSDRTVYAHGNGYQIVRYERAGKWYIEHADGTRKPATIDQAVHEAERLRREHRGTILLGQPGGSAFDRKLRRHQEADQI